MKHTYFFILETEIAKKQQSIVLKIQHIINSSKRNSIVYFFPTILG